MIDNLKTALLSLSLTSGSTQGSPVKPAVVSAGGLWLRAVTALYKGNLATSALTPDSIVLLWVLR